MAGHEQRGAAEGQPDGGERSGAAGMGDGELVGGRHGDDARYDGQMEVGAGGPSQPAGVLRVGDGLAGVLGATGEVDPPQRPAADKGPPKSAMAAAVTFASPKVAPVTRMD